MINEAVCSYEVSKLLAEKNIFIDSFFKYTFDKELVLSSDEGLMLYYAPTHQSVMEHLRKKCNIFVEILHEALDGELQYWIRVEQYIEGMFFVTLFQDDNDKKYYSDYPIAVEKALTIILTEIL